MSEAAPSPGSSARIAAPIATPRAGHLHAGLSSVTKKYAVAMSGLALVGFLFAHLAGNLLILIPGAFDQYAAALHASPLLPLAEIGLFAVFVVHVALALACARANRDAKPQKYAVAATRGKATLASRTMVITGSAVLVFVIVHIAHMKFRAPLFGNPTVETGSQWVLRTLAHPLGALVYAVGVCAVGVHLSHGVWSLFQTLGWNSKRWHARLTGISRAVGALLAAGFLLIVVYALLRGGR
ncbi:MAG: succinate dehydrogenase cytochrome b subunit [Planctomycetes bacterium]|nr:succinate dehydrogenase cytochrome b subunit [Planctomycetota bacterium]